MFGTGMAPCTVEAPEDQFTFRARTKLEHITRHHTVTAFVFSHRIQLLL